MPDQRAAASLRRTTDSFTICQPYRPAESAMRPRRHAEFRSMKFRRLEDRAAAWLTGHFRPCPPATALRPCRPRQQARPAVRAGIQMRNSHADRPGRPSHAHRRGAAQGRRRVGGGSRRGGGRLRQRQSRRPRLARRDRDPDLYRPHQGRPYRARREMDHRAGIADHDRDRRPLGVRLSRQRQGDGADDREGEDRQRRRLHGVPPEPCRAARRLSA